jgi:hypothetical protein
MPGGNGGSGGQGGQGGTGGGGAGGPSAAIYVGANASFALRNTSEVAGKAGSGGGTAVTGLSGQTIPAAATSNPAQDSDGDGVPDITDLCPTVPGGPTDLGHNGCPGSGTFGNPTATINTPITGGEYHTGQAVATVFSCADASGAPGIASCVDSNGQSAPRGHLDTSNVGTRTYTVTATSIDGQSSTATIKYTVVLAPPKAALIRTSTMGTTARLSLSCAGLRSQRCASQIAATATLGATGAPIPNVRARASTVSVAKAAFSVAGGRIAHIRVELNTIGRRLMTRFYRLPTIFTFPGSGIPSRRMVFDYPLVTPRPKIDWAGFTWANPPCGFCYTTADVNYFFGVPKLIPTATVAVSCTGVHCPPPHSFGPGTRRVSLAGMFKGRRLGPGSVIRIRITAPNSVGRLVTFTTLTGRYPRIGIWCLPPGVRKPTPCTGNS